jgi:hypothetical protein
MEPQMLSRARVFINVCFVIRPIRRKKWSKVSWWIALFEFIAVSAAFT